MKFQFVGSFPTLVVIVAALFLGGNPLNNVFAQIESATNSAAYDKNACQPGSHDVPNPYPAADLVAPDHFYVKMPSTVSDGIPIIFEVNRTWSPFGADRFFALAKDNYFDCAAFFRVIPSFVVQWGIASDPVETVKWGTAIPDDPVMESNTKGMVSFATSGPGTRTTQIFVNTADNSFLDTQGFSPFARVVQGMEEVFLGNNMYVADPVPNQFTYESEGNAWILEDYPAIDIVKGLPQGDSVTNTTTEVMLTLEEKPDEEQEELEENPFESDSSSGSSSSDISSDASSSASPSLWTKIWSTTTIFASTSIIVVGW
ncbi:unnamed protein product [Pseudo-nitzschia multistriata]|uniref:PPIase cyclophilin-type domain-containing protein n=1 Tax=Pseudo-nitzschia multistriata TaxID=183589 RepID=A0A448Z1G1_9STRA|nr:unnamed protein product [Pseudo-nitzschia multistriata]